MRAMSDAQQIALLDGLPRVRVLVVGDVMLDRFIYGSVDRVSPEAPIPVLQVNRETAMLGAAGNVVRNLAALGSRPHLVAAIGGDAAGDEVGRLLARIDVEPDLIVDPSRMTTIKSRFVAGAQQLLRTDQEHKVPLRAALEDRVLEAAGAALADCGAVVLSDYGKGVLSDAVLGGVLDAAQAHGLPVVVDPKGDDYDRYRGATLVTPNRRELAAAARLPTHDDDAVVAAARHVIATCGIRAVLATRGPEGMSLVPAEGPAVHLPATAQEVFDVSGAGDTVAGVVAAALGAGAPPVEAAALANLAAGVVVAKAGTAAVGLDEMHHALRRHELDAGEAKVLGHDELMERLARWRGRNFKIGFTNGCFDLLHPGHVALLAQARAACDRLVVGLNTDASVARLKGPHRPVQGETARATVLASLATVDAVVPFAEDTPIALIEAIRPDVLVKGADYTEATVVGAEIVKAYGGRVLLADLVDGESTTATLARIGS